MTRVVRRMAAMIAIATLAFGQLAVSAYACSVHSAALGKMAMEESETPCERVVNANLCERHCEYGSAMVQQSSIDSTPVFVPVVLPPQLQPSPHPVLPSFVRDRALHPAHSPPALTLFGVLRI